MMYVRVLFPLSSLALDLDREMKWTLLITCTIHLTVTRPLPEIHHPSTNDRSLLQLYLLLGLTRSGNIPFLESATDIRNVQRLS